MSVGYVQKATVTNATSTTAVTPVLAAAPTSGNLLIAVLTAISQTTITAPTGWVLLGSQDAGSNTRAWAYYKAAGAAEPASNTWTIGTATKNWGVVLEYSGWDPATPPVFAGVADASSTSMLTPSIVVPEGGWLVSAAGTRHTATGTASVWSTSDGSDVLRLSFGSNAGTGADIAGGVFDSNRGLVSAAYTRTLTSTNTEGQVAALAVAFGPVQPPLPPALSARWGVFA